MPHANRTARYGWRAVLPVLVAWLGGFPPAHAGAVVGLGVQHLETSSLVIEGLKLRGQLDGPAVVTLDSLKVGDLHWRKVYGRCEKSAMAIDEKVWHCPRLYLRQPGKPDLQVAASYDAEAKHLSLQSRQARWKLVISPQITRFEARSTPMAALQKVAAWIGLGKAMPGVQGSLTFKALQRGDGQWQGNGFLSQGGFSTKDGGLAAEQVTARFSFRWLNGGEASVAFERGLFWAAPWLVDLQGLESDLQIALGRGGQWKIDNLKLVAPALGRMTAKIQASGRGMVPKQISGRIAWPDVAPLAAKLLSPWWQAQGGSAWTGKGQLDLAFDWRSGTFRQFAVSADSVSLSSSDGRYGLTNLSARLPWQSEGEGRWWLRWNGLKLGVLPLGAATLQGEMKAGRLMLETTEIPFLDGTLHAGPGHWQPAVQKNASSGALVLALAPVSLNRLAPLLGWPSMGGSLAGSVPAIRWQRDKLTLDGGFALQVFDGYVVASKLQLLSPFGHAPRLVSEVEFRDLDLRLMTDTYDFGRIEGRIEGGVKGLEMVNWVPERFEVRIATADVPGPRRLSNLAVQNIAALGGGGATAAIQGSFLRLFRNFGYRRLGVSARLEQGVCLVDGIAAAPGGGYLLVEGSGTPAVNVIGYNRRIAWAELVDRMKRVITGNAPIIVK